MATKFQRRVKFTRIRCVETVVENGVARLESIPDIIIYGLLSDDQAAAKLRKLYEGRSISILSTERHEGLYEMPVETFIQYATPVSGEDEQRADDRDVPDEAPEDNAEEAPKESGKGEDYVPGGYVPAERTQPEEHEDAHEQPDDFLGDSHYQQKGQDPCDFGNGDAPFDY